MFHQHSVLESNILSYFSLAILRIASHHCSCSDPERGLKLASDTLAGEIAYSECW